MPISQQRTGEILRVTMETLRDAGGRMSRSRLMDAAERRLMLTADEQRITREVDQMPAWGMRFGFSLSAAKRVGWLSNGDARGVWTLTPAGLAALGDLPGDELFRELRRLDPKQARQS